MTINTNLSKMSSVLIRKLVQISVMPHGHCKHHYFYNTGHIKDVGDQAKYAAVIASCSFQCLFKYVYLLLFNSVIKDKGWMYPLQLLHM